MTSPPLLWAAGATCGFTGATLLVAASKDFTVGHRCLATKSHLAAGGTAAVALSFPAGGASTLGLAGACRARMVTS